MMKFLCLLFVHVLAVVDLCTALNLTCSPAAVTVTVHDSEGFNGWYILLADHTSCTSVQQFNDTIGYQSVTFPCFFYDLGDAFSIMLLNNGSTVLSEQDDIVKLNGTCNSDTFVNVSRVGRVETPDASESISDVLEAEVGMVISPTTASIGQNVTVTIFLRSAYRSYYRINLKTLNVASPTSGLDIVVDSCPITYPVAPSISGKRENRPPFRIDVSYPGFLPFENGILTSVTPLRVTATLTVCSSGNYSSCYDPDDCSGGPYLGRRRRQDDSVQLMTVSHTMTFFTSEEERQAYVAEILEQEGIPGTCSRTDEDFCLNKSVSAVLTTFLVIGMVLCLVLTLWMFFKMRKIRKIWKPSSRDKPLAISSLGHSNRASKVSVDSLSNLKRAVY